MNDKLLYDLRLQLSPIVLVELRRFLAVIHVLAGVIWEQEVPGSNPGAPIEGKCYAV